MIQYVNVHVNVNVPGSSAFEEKGWDQDIGPGLGLGLALGLGGQSLNGLYMQIRFKR